MSSALYALGRWAAQAKRLVFALWIVLLVLLGGGALLFSQGANAPITIPGTESQAALDTLGRTFPEVSGTSAQIILVAREGDLVTDPAYQEEIQRAAEVLETLPQVNAVQTPFGELASGGLAESERAALITIQIGGDIDSVPDELDQGIRDVAADLMALLPEGTQTSVGGEIYSVSVPGLSPTEAIGIVVAFIVLIITLGSLTAAGMPLLIALIGVGVSMAGLFFVTAFVDLTSTTPMLALMLGLAVGIDYTLFIVSRHQEQLRDGIPLRESIARATATSGSAVVFAGLTVMIALLGLSVAGIPFLTSLGVAAAAAVAIAVLIAVTLTPAVLSMAGMKILPKRARRALVQAEVSAAEDSELVEEDTASANVSPSRAERFFARWVRAVTVKPALTIIAVLLTLGAAAIPAFDLRLALPNASGLPADDPARVTYELTAEHFGEGYNGPLLLAGSIISSTDPVGLMDDLAEAVRQVPGVVDVPLATPNLGADTGIIQVVPEEGPHAVSTVELVQNLRDMHDAWEDEFGVSLAVTGFTAVGIDVSRLLFEALIPFSILVVGLSLVLLAMVFRSVWVPIKATLGYLLSVGVAFGAVVSVFQWGWFADLLHVPATGPVLSFMPIILMGVLFGLAMDYELFLVSRMREEYAHGSDPQSAIHRGFVGSGRVVSAAAIIMFAVFAAFVPEGDPSIKVIALGLAVGVFVDAFIVRMILVPAVMALLGKQAWWMPRWLQRALPHFDVEGEGLTREIAHENWPEDLPHAAIASENLVIEGRQRVPDLRVPPGTAILLDPHTSAARGLARVLSGRGTVSRGTLKVQGLLLPDRASSLRRRAAWLSPETAHETLRDAPGLVVITGLGGATSWSSLLKTREALTSWQASRMEFGAPAPTIVVLAEEQYARKVIPKGMPLQEVEVLGSREHEKQEIVR